MEYSSELLNKALNISLEWGENWLAPIQQRLKEKETRLTDTQLNEIDELCRQQVTRFAWKQFEAEADGEQTVSEAKATIMNAFPWISPDNLAQLSSQGQYYARK
jgi:hypothetical protein